MKITLYPPGGPNYPKVYLDCEIVDPYEPRMAFTGRLEGLDRRVRVVTNTDFIIEHEVTDIPKDAKPVPFAPGWMTVNGGKTN